jgi:VanZ family protein
VTTPQPERTSYPRLPWLGAAFLIATFVFVESSFAAPSIGGPRADELASSMAHFCIFTALAYCCLRAFSRGGLMRAGLISLGVFLLGVSDEFHQAFVPSRHASIADAGIDLAGAVFGSFAAEVLRPGRPPGGES